MSIPGARYLQASRGYRTEKVAQTLGFTTLPTAQSWSQPMRTYIELAHQQDEALPERFKAKPSSAGRPPMERGTTAAIA
jgi:hypothetical protein